MTPIERIHRDIRRAYRIEIASKVIAGIIGNTLRWGLMAAVVIGVAKLMGVL